MTVIAVVAIAACLLVKLLLSLRAKSLGSKLGEEKLLLEMAKKEMHKAEGKGQILEAQRKQLQAKQQTIQKKLDGYNKILGNYAVREEKAKTLEQEELLKEAKKRR